MAATETHQITLLLARIQHGDYLIVMGEPSQLSKLEALAAQTTP